MDKSKKKIETVKILILVIALMVLVFSASYAYYTNTKEENPTTTTATSGKFNISSSLDTTGNAIVNTKMVLLNETDLNTKADKLTFTVTSDSETNVDGLMDIYLKEIKISKNLKSSDFHWELLQKVDETGEDTTTIDGEHYKKIASDTFDKLTDKTGTTATVPTEDDAKAVVEAENLKLNSNSISLPQKKEQTFIFRLYLLNNPNANQIELTEGSFQGKLYLEAVPVSALKD